MKRGKVLTFIVSLFSISLISAETVLERFVGSSSAVVAESLEKIKLNPTLLSTVLLAILLWMIIYSILKQMELFKNDERQYFKNATAFVISIIITWLSFIFLPDNFIESIVLQYGAMGAAILAFIPFAIIFYFSMVTVQSLLLARVIWIFYSFYYLVLFMFKAATSAVSEGLTTAWPYLAAFVAGIIIFFGIKFFRNLIFKGELDAKEEKALQDVDFRKMGRKIEREETKSRTDTK